MRLEALINKNYDLLTANDREIANTIFREKKAVREMNSTQLSSFLNISRTTLVRFMKKLGIATFAEFRLLLEEEQGSRNVMSFGMRDILNHYHTVIDELKKQGHSPNYIYRGHKADLFDGGHRIPCLLRWPDKVKPHTVSQTICLTDFYATFAAVAGHRMADTEGEDSYNLRPALDSEKEVAPIREATVHHSINGEFSIRKGKWKLLVSPSSGGWSYPRPGKDDAVIATLPRVQLYDMEADPTERKNLEAVYPEVVKELKDLLARYVQNGRSTPGEPQTNDGPEWWKQLSWMKE